MAQAQVTASMQASADNLLSRRHLWVRGRRKRDSLGFYLFPSSDGRTAYYTAISGDGCSCRGYLYRGVCSHSIAARADFDQARAEAARPRRSYDDLFPRDDLDEAF